eukprot:PhM_4_TR6463/c0_g1_i1/m.3582
MRKSIFMRCGSSDPIDHLRRQAKRFADLYVFTDFDDAFRCLDRTWSWTVEFDRDRSQTFAFFGEAGSGKTTAMLSMCAYGFENTTIMCYSNRFIESMPAPTEKELNESGEYERKILLRTRVYKHIASRVYDIMGRSNVRALFEAPRDELTFILAIDDVRAHDDVAEVLRYRGAFGGIHEHLREMANIDNRDHIIWRSNLALAGNGMVQPVPGCGSQCSFHKVIWASKNDIFPTLMEQHGMASLATSLRRHPLAKLMLRNARLGAAVVDQLITSQPKPLVQLLAAEADTKCLPRPLVDILHTAASVYKRKTRALNTLSPADTLSMLSQALQTHYFDVRPADGPFSLANLIDTYGLLVDENQRCSHDVVPPRYEISPTMVAILAMTLYPDPRHVAACASGGEGVEHAALIAVQMGVMACKGLCVDAFERLLRSWHPQCPAQQSPDTMPLLATATSTASPTPIPATLSVTNMVYITAPPSAPTCNVTGALGGGKFGSSQARRPTAPKPS